MPISQEDAINYIVKYLKEKDDAGYSTYGYDLYLPNLMTKYLGSTGRPQQDMAEISTSIYDAAWALCRRGILRPGINKWGNQATDDGSAGNGYSITPFGQTWLDETDKGMFVPTEPGRFSAMISPFADIFGKGFQDRATEAIRCYEAHAYLACCTMCGAAAESILLHLAIQKVGDEDEVLSKYKQSNGRKKLEDIIIGQAKGGMKNEFEVNFSLLKYWRDEAGHGRPSQISDNEAFTSLSLLLRCAIFARDNYSILTTSGGSPNTAPSTNTSIGVAKP